MSQRETLQAMDADLHAAFASAGMADPGVYIAAGTSAEIPCQCYFDNTNLQEQGDAGVVMYPRKEITILRVGGEAGSPVLIDPKRGDQVQLDGKVYILQVKQDSDEGATRWTVTYE